MKDRDIDEEKLCSLVLLFAMILSAVPANAVEVKEPRASAYFDAYAMSIVPEGNGRMAVSFAVYGTGRMNKIGVYSLRIETEFAPDKWVEEFTVYGEDHATDFFSENIYEHIGGYYFTGIPGLKYRAVLVAYAEDASGSEYSREISCTGKYCT